MYAIIVTTSHKVSPDEWDTDTEVLLFSDDASADVYLENHPPHRSETIHTKYFMIYPTMPNMEVDAYSEARAMILQLVEDALGSESMGAGVEEAVMNRVLDVLKED